MQTYAIIHVNAIFNIILFFQYSYSYSRFYGHATWFKIFFKYYYSNFLLNLPVFSPFPIFAPRLRPIASAHLHVYFYVLVHSHVQHFDLQEFTNIHRSVCHTWVEFLHNGDNKYNNKSSGNTDTILNTEITACCTLPHTRVSIYVHTSIYVHASACERLSVGQSKTLTGDNQQVGNTQQTEKQPKT